MAMAGLVSSGLTFAQPPAKAPTTAVFSPWQPAPEKLPAWDMALLGTPPATQPAMEVPVDGVQAIWIDTLPLQGKPTKAFGRAKRDAAFFHRRVSRPACR